MPTVWNASPYDLYPGDGSTILANTTVTVLGSDYVTAAILAGLLVIADGNHTATTGLGNPAQTQTAPTLAQLPPTASDGKTLPAGSELPVDATAADRTVILPKARVGVVVGFSKVDNGPHQAMAYPHETDTIIPASLASLATPQTAVRLFGYVGGWVAVPYNPDAVTGAALFTQLATMGAGQQVAGGQTVTGGSTVSGGSRVAGGQTVSNGQTVTGGQNTVGGTTTDTLTVNGAVTASGLVTATKGAKITGGLTADTGNIGPWVLGLDPYGNPSVSTPNPSNVSMIGYQGALYICNANNTARADLHAANITLDSAGWTLGRDPSHNPALLSSAGGTGIVSVGNVLYVVSAANTLNHGALTAGSLTVDNHGQFGSLDSANGIGTPANINAGTIHVGPIYTNVINATGDILNPGLTQSTDANGVMRSLNYYGGTFTGHGNFDNNYAVAAASSSHLKTDIETISGEQARDAVMAWRFVTYRWADPEVHPHSMDDHLHAGLLADEVAATAPEIAHDYVARLHNHPDDDSSRLEPFTEEVIGIGLEDRGLIGYLGALVQQQQREIEDLRARLDRLDAVSTP